MKTLSDAEFDRQRDKIIGLGEKSTRKSYYPELQRRVQELDKKNRELKREIEQRRLAEAALSESEQLYRTLAESTKEGIAIISQTQEIIFSNPAFNVIFMRSPDETRQMNIMAFVDPEYREALETYLERFRKGEADEIFTGRCVRGDGSKIWVQGSHRLIDWAGKEAFLATMRDVTAEREREINAQRQARELQQENQLLKSEKMHRYGLGPLVGTSPVMQEVYASIIKAATIESNVVVYGESGTGKELVSRAIHDLSRRQGQPYVTVNCGAIPENLFESEFFGHKKGAFSGANMDKVGFFESADRGTLFLDEIGEVPQNLQVKLLRAIEGGGYTPIGDTGTKHSDVRIIAATNQNLQSLADEGIVRQDFFFRIHIIPITLPPLKDRREDIPLLVYHFFRKMAGGTKKNIVIPDAIMEKFQRHDWPGNVRELQNAVSRYAAFNTTDFFHESGSSRTLDVNEIPLEKTGLNPLVTDYEKKIIETALKRTGGNISRASDLLKIGRRSLQRKITRLQISN